MLRCKLLLVLSLFLTSYVAKSQSEEGKYEIGGSIGSVFFMTDGLSQPHLGLHLHGMRRIFTTRFAAGLGYEYVNDDHKHRTYSAVLQYEVMNAFKVLFAPGLATEVHHDDFETSFSYHLELNYDIELGKMHVGPSIEYAYDKHDQHLSFGVHIGTSF